MNNIYSSILIGCDFEMRFWKIQGSYEDTVICPAIKIDLHILSLIKDEATHEFRVMTVKSLRLLGMHRSHIEALINGKAHI